MYRLDNRLTQWTRSAGRRWTRPLRWSATGWGRSDLRSPMIRPRWRSPWSRASSAARPCRAPSPSFSSRPQPTDENIRKKFDNRQSRKFKTGQTMRHLYFVKLQLLIVTLITDSFSVEEMSSMLLCWANETKEINVAKTNVKVEVFIILMYWLLNKYKNQFRTNQIILILKILEYNFNKICTLILKLILILQKSPRQTNQAWIYSSRWRIPEITTIFNNK